MTLLTVFADASYCPHTHVGGWGAWAKRHDWPSGQVYSGKVVTAATPASCELRALANALYCLDTSGGLDGIRTVLLQSDCTWALQAICTIPGTEQRATELEFPIPAKLTIRPADQPVLDFLVQLAAQRGLVYRVRHVKGHNGTDTGRSWVNTTCDRLAREKMLEQRRAAIARPHIKSKRHKRHLKRKKERARPSEATT